MIDVRWTAHVRTFPLRAVLNLAAVLLLLAVLSSCGGDETQPIVTPDVPTRLFWEPRSYCLPHGDSSDTLFVTNFDDTAVVWTPTHSPAGSSNLTQPFTVPPLTTVAVVWTWNPAGTAAVDDSLVARTDEPARISILFRRESSSYVDNEAPPAPILARPDDGDTFQVGNIITPIWTRVSDCSGINRYELQVATDSQFQQIVLNGSVGLSETQVVVEPGDEGPAWWRVRARDNTGRASPWSAPRSWTVTGP